jgi:hypothetical protein
MYGVVHEKQASMEKKDFWLKNNLYKLRYCARKAGYGLISSYV